MSWGDRARQAIARIEAAQSADATVADRLKAIDAGYPFGPRSGWPYKAWLRARREWMGRNRILSQRKHETPLERAIRRTREAEASARARLA